MGPWETLTFKGQMEEGNLMKMEEWFKRLEEKQKRVTFCKLGEEFQRIGNGQQIRTLTVSCW